MSMFAKALRRAEVFLEQVDDRVAQASRKFVVDGATGYDEDEDYATDEDAENPNAQPRRRAAEIARAVDPTRPEQDPAAPTTEEKQVPDEDVVEPRKLAFEPDAVADESIVIPEAEQAGAGPSLSKEQTVKPPVMQAQSQAAIPQKISLPQASLSAPGALARPREAGSSSHTAAKPPIQTSVSQGAPSQNAAAPQNAAAGFLMGITKVRETAGSLLGDAMLDDNQYINELQTENSALRKELEQLEEEFEDLRKERNKMVKNLKRMKEIVSEMDESLQEKSGEARRLESELVEAKDEAQKLRADMAAANARDKEALETMRARLTGELQAVRKSEVSLKAERSSLMSENQSLMEALKSGQDLELAISTGARKEATEAHHAYETEVAAHRETKRLVKEREESLEAQAALAANALAAAERKADECLATATAARSAQRVAESKLSSAIRSGDIAFARIEDLEHSLRKYEGEDGAGPPGQDQLESMQVTIAELENALEAKNVELKRLEGEVEALKDALAARRDLKSPRSPSIRAMTGASPTHSVEVEQKLRHMADASLRKQAQLEVLRSENRALQHQLDTERKRTREAQAMAAAASSSRQSIRGGFRGILEEGDEERGVRHYGMRDGPLARFRAPRNWPRYLVRAITVVDQVSAQALGFLRKEPLLRIVLMVYVFLVHFFMWRLLRYHTDAITRSVDVNGLAKGGGAVN